MTQANIGYDSNCCFQPVSTHAKDVEAGESGVRAALAIVANAVHSSEESRDVGSLVAVEGVTEC